MSGAGELPAKGRVTVTIAATKNRTRSVKRPLLLTVGPREGDLRGDDDRILQAAADYLHRLGGGTLQILPGQYTMSNALYLHPHITIRGAGESTVLRKAPGACTPITRDSDWYENRVTVRDPGPFAPGCGIMLRSYRNGRIHEAVRDTVTHVEGDELTLSRRLEKNSWLEDEATAATLFPLLTAAEHVDDVCVESLVLDGNREHNDEINGNYAGAVFIQHCHRFTFRAVIARNYNGDGFSFQVCDDIHFERCRSENNANLGFHPGSGSQRPIFRNCSSRGNAQGIFFCWGVTDGLVDDCDCSQNRDFGISIGHRDTDNRILNTRIEGNHKVGVLFRERGGSEYRGGHRNLIEGCLVRDNGFAADGVGIDVDGPTHDTVVRNTRFEDSGDGRQRIGVRIGEQARNVQLEANTFLRMEREVVEPVPSPAQAAGFVSP